MARGTLRIGTRGSALALWQTERVRSLLAAAGYGTEKVEIKTTGDLTPDVPLSSIGSRALFTKQIDDALLEGRVDLAVHSLKDLPTQLPEGLRIGAIGLREDARDALVSRAQLQWQSLPEGAVIGTSSLRRRAQLLYHRPDLKVVDLRGNVDTRLAKFDANTQWSAIVLATAGLVRLGLDGRIGERLAPELMLPAPGQGVLAVSVRVDDDDVAIAVRDAMHDPVSGLRASAERSFLAGLEGGCQVPIAAHAVVRTGERQSVLQLHGRVIASDGRAMVEGHQLGPVTSDEEASALGAALAARLLAQGAGTILAQSRGVSSPRITAP